MKITSPILKSVDLTSRRKNSTEQLPIKKLKKLTKKQHTAAAALTAAAVEFIDLQNRTTHPAGTFDNARRFYPAETFECCAGIRTPSAAYPFSLMVHARTADHIANKYKVEPSEIRKLKKVLSKNEETLNLSEERTFYKIMKNTLDAKDFPAFLTKFRRDQIFKFAAEIILDKEK